MGWQCPAPMGSETKGNAPTLSEGGLVGIFIFGKGGTQTWFSGSRAEGHGRGLWLIVPLSVQPDHRPPGPKTSSDPPRERPDAAHSSSAALRGSVLARISQRLTKAPCSCTLPSHFSFDLIIFPISSVS